MFGCWFKYSFHDGWFKWWNLSLSVLSNHFNFTFVNCIWEHATLAITLIPGTKLILHGAITTKSFSQRDAGDSNFYLRGVYLFHMFRLPPSAKPCKCYLCSSNGKYAIFISRFDSNGRGVQSTDLYFYPDKSGNFWFCFIFLYIFVFHIIDYFDIFWFKYVNDFLVGKNKLNGSMVQSFFWHLAQSKFDRFCGRTSWWCMFGLIEWLNEDFCSERGLQHLGQPK